MPSNRDVVDRFAIEVRCKHRGQTFRSRTRKRSVLYGKMENILENWQGGWGGWEDGRQEGLLQGEILEEKGF